MPGRLVSLFFGACVTLVLAGCQETTTAARPRVNAPGIPVSVQSISGAPDQITTSFASLLNEAAAQRKMEIVADNVPARFRVRGYLTAQPTEDGQTALSFVWDVYDSSKKRAQRVQGESLGKRSGADPWAGVDRSVVAKAAADSVDAIADFLVNTPPDEKPVTNAPKEKIAAKAGDRRS